MLLLVELQLDAIERIGNSRGIDMPGDRVEFESKSPTQVFQLSVEVFSKLNLIAGHSKISPDEVFAEFVRAGKDLRSILEQADPACRYHIDCRPSPKGMIPADVFALCLQLRKQINRKRVELGLPAVLVPKMPEGEINPIGPFIQSQIIIADLNRLKLATGTTSVTPLAIPVSGKTPTDLHGQVASLGYLLKQVGSRASE